MEFNSVNTKINKSHNGVWFLEFEPLNKINFIKHAFSTKIGGVSQNEYFSMNLSFVRGDDEKNVIENYERFSAAIGFNCEKIVSARQTHSVNVRKVGKNDCKNNDISHCNIENVDALITNEKDVVLITHHADCTPIYFLDRRAKAIGLAHAGWRGSVDLIARNTINSMKKEFNSKPQEIICVIGPTIGNCCYEVDQPVAEKVFNLNFLPLEKIIKRQENEKFILNLKELNKQILIYSGVLDKNITVSDICTACNSDLLFSHRATNGKRGGAVAMLTIK